MPLIMVGIGETCTIQRIGGSEETRRFLANLGFVQGAEVTVLSAIGGNVIVNIKDSRVAINKDMARQIMGLYVCFIAFIGINCHVAVYLIDA